MTIELSSGLFKAISRHFHGNTVNGINHRRHPNGGEVIAWVSETAVQGWLIFAPETKEIILMVHPRYRRQGVGTALIREAQSRWGVNLNRQRWTKDGQKLRRSLE